MQPNWAWLILATPLALACRQEQPDPAAASNTAGPPIVESRAAPPMSDSDLERLTTLGYVDSASEPADESRNGAIVHDRAKTSPGPTLATSHTPCRAVLIDLDGRTLNSWNGAADCPNWVNGRLYRDGSLLVTEGKGGLALFQWNGDRSWRRSIGAHHAADRAFDNQLVALLQERRKVSPLPRDDAPGEPMTILDNSIALLDGEGLVVESASIYDLLRATPGIVLDTTHLPDFLHSNSVEWMRRPALAEKNPIYALRNVLLSVRKQNLLLIVDWDRKKIVWFWGQGVLDNQHDASVLDGGNILLFDNGLRRGWSRILEIDPLSREIVWEYGAAPAERFHSRGRGSVQRLPNGNTLISVSDDGYAIEVSPTRQIVWEFRNPNLVSKPDGKHRTPIWLRRYPQHWLEQLGRPASR